MRGDVAETAVGLPAPPPEGPVDRVLRNGTMTVVAQGLNAAFNVVVVFVLARSLGKEGFGQFYALFALIMVVQLLAEASLSTVLTCRLAQEPGQWQKIVAEATGLFAVVVAASALVFLGLGGVWAWVRGEPALFSAFAIYNVAYRPLGPLNWLPRIILVAAFPAFARLAAGDRSGLSRALAASIRLLWVISLPLAVAIFACAEPLITLLAGPDYVDAVLPLRILIWISTLSFLSMQFRFVFTAVGRQKLFARLAVAVFGLEAAIELALIPWWGYFGACAGSL